MARVKINVSETHTLDELIPAYAENKSMLDDYKKLCDIENKQIKELMEEGTYEASGYKATKSITTRETMNEDKLLELLLDKGYGNTSVIKQKYYVDMNALESAIYSGEIPKEDLLEMDKCREVKEVVTLRISKVKESKDGKTKEV